MAMHGHTRIELQDVNTGQKKVVEDGNMITNGLTECLRPVFGLNNILSTYDFSEYNTVGHEDFGTLIKGILCFEKPQEEKVENYFRDYANPIVARGSKITYSGSDTELGSFNNEESGIQEDGRTVKHVWDFNTSQGNGTISSVSLTTYLGGLVGDGSKQTNFAVSQEIGKSKGLFDRINLCSRAKPIPISSEYVVYVDGKGNSLYIMNTYSVYNDSGHSAEYFRNSHVLKIGVYEFPFTKISLLKDATGRLAKKETIEIPVPDTILEQCNGTNNFTSWYCDEGYIFILLIKGGTVYEGGILRVLKYNIATGESEVLNITNNTEARMYFYPIDRINPYNFVNSYGWGMNGGPCNITNKYFTFASFTDQKIYRISLDNNADVISFKMNGEEFLADIVKNDGMVHRMERIGDLLYCVQGDRTDKRPHILNIKTGEAKYFPADYDGKTYLRFIDGERRSPVTVMGIRSPVCLYSYVYGTAYRTTVFYRHDILFTINNLPEPVVKTASQTMKITYTISEE